MKMESLELELKTLVTVKKVKNNFKFENLDPSTY